MRKVLFVTIAFVAIYNILFYHTHLGVGTGFLFLALNLYFFLTRNKESKNLGLAIVSSTFGILFAFLFSFRANIVTQIVDLAASVFFSLVGLYLHKQPEKFIPQILSFLLLPILTIKDSLASAFAYTNPDNWPSKSEKNSDVTNSLIRGIVITVPVVGILLFLLVQADPVFEKLTKDFIGNLGERTVISLIILIILLVFGLAKIITKIGQQTDLKKVIAGKAHELGIITGSIITLFAIFIVIQFRYLFSGVGERELHQLGVASLTYSEYVRKGFFELLIASVIASTVIIYVLRFLQQLKGNQKMLIQLSSGFLTIETGLLLLSAAKRVVLYADSHGLTRARVFGFIFLLWLAIMLINFLIRLIKEMRREHFFASVITVTLAAFLTINIINIDGLIATKYKPTVNNEIDYFYLASLSTDAYEGWKPAIKDTANLIAYLESVNSISTEDNRKLYWIGSTLIQLNEETKYLVDKYGTLTEFLAWHKKDEGDWIQKVRKSKRPEDLPETLKDYRKWQSWNLSEYTAYKEISNDMLYFEQIPLLLDRVFKIEQRVSDEVRQSTPIDRSTQPPLIR